LLLEGAAGIGKSTLWHAGVSVARARGHRVLACRAAESEARLSHTALGDLFDFELTGDVDVARSDAEEGLRPAPPWSRRSASFRSSARRCGRRARDDLARVGGAMPPSGELTPTEQRIAQLVGEGKKNREIAEALFISVKTVEANLSRIFHKLGVRSRTELTRRIDNDRASPGFLTAPQDLACWRR
jgi:DNA-binding CsgD family transcriptional regulator